MPPKEYSFDEVVRGVAEEMMTKDRVATFFASPEGRAAIAELVSTQVAEVRTKLESDVAEERKLRTAAQEAAADLLARFEKFERQVAYDRESQFHRGLDGKIKPSVRRETAEALYKLFRGLANKDMDAVRAVSTSTGSEGGFVVTTEVATDVLRLIPEMGLYPSLAREMPIPTGKTDIGSVLSQMGAYWPGENNAITESFPGFGKVHLEGKLCGALIPAPIQLINNASPNMGQLFADLIRECILKEIDRVGIAGKSAANSGTDVFDGLLYADSVVSVVLGSGKTHISDVDPDTLLTMQTAVPEGARADCAYIMEPTLLDSVRKVKTSTGDYVSASFYTPPSGNEPPKLWGKPVYESSRMPAYSTASTPSKRCVSYGNFKQWAIFGTNMDLQIASSDTAGDAFKNCQVVFRGITTVAVAAFGPALAELETAAS